MLEGIQSAIDHVTAAVQEELAVVESIVQSTRMLAVVEAAYIVSAADGALSQAETQKITQGIRAIAEGVTTDEQVQTMLEIAADRLKVVRPPRERPMACAIWAASRSALASGLPVGSAPSGGFFFSPSLR